MPLWLLMGMGGHTLSSSPNKNDGDGSRMPRDTNLIGGRAQLLSVPSDHLLWLWLWSHPWKRRECKWGSEDQGVERAATSQKAGQGKGSKLPGGNVGRWVSKTGENIPEPYGATQGRQHRRGRRAARPRLWRCSQAGRQAWDLRVAWQWQGQGLMELVLVASFPSSVIPLMGAGPEERTG